MSLAISAEHRINCPVVFPPGSLCKATRVGILVVYDADFLSFNGYFDLTAVFLVLASNDPLPDCSFRPTLVLSNGKIGWVVDFKLELV